MLLRGLLGFLWITTNSLWASLEEGATEPPKTSHGAVVSASQLEPKWLQQERIHLSEAHLEALSPLAPYLFYEGQWEGQRYECFKTLKLCNVERLKVLGQHANVIFGAQEHWNIEIIQCLSDISDDKFQRVVAQADILFHPKMSSENRYTILDRLSSYKRNRFNAFIEYCPGIASENIHLPVKVLFNCLALLSPKDIKEYAHLIPPFLNSRGQHIICDRTQSWGFDQHFDDFVRVIEANRSKLFWGGITGAEKNWILRSLTCSSNYRIEELADLIDTYQGILFQKGMEGTERAWVVSSFARFVENYEVMGLSSRVITNKLMDNLQYFMRPHMNGYQRAWVLLGFAEMDGTRVDDITSSLQHFFPKKITGYQLGYVLSVMGAEETLDIQCLTGHRVVGFDERDRTLIMNLTPLHKVVRWSLKVKG